MTITGTQLSMIDVETMSFNHGEVFTRRWVVDFILDLVGYTTDADLGRLPLLEPACGDGAFLVAVVERLLQVVGPTAILDATDLITAIDIREENVRSSRRLVASTLCRAGVPPDAADELARSWVRQGDFLLDDTLGSFDVVVGNPPYVRIEEVDAERMSEYRDRNQTMRGRSDLYVGFIERGLRALSATGTLGVICADRWMHNQYGARLRALVGDDYAMETIVRMHDVDAFATDVAAYPAVTIIGRRAGPAGTVVADASGSFGRGAADTFRDWRAEGGQTLRTPDVRAARIGAWPVGPGLWPAGSPGGLPLVRRLEASFGSLESDATGTRVGIGVATGADAVFLVGSDHGIEPDRLVPLVRTADLADGALRWGGTLLVNPWDREGLVDLDDHPGLRSYLRAHEDRLRSRYVARRSPQTWFRTVDRVHPDLTTRPKLLIPDLKARAHPVLDPGTAYPDHNLYYIVSDTWDLAVLGGLLLSDVTNLFIASYCVRMRGGTYRFQAQYLRMIRVPDPGQVVASQGERLAQAFADRDREAATAVACEVYDIDPEELRRALAGEARL